MLLEYILLGIWFYTPIGLANGLAVSSRKWPIIGRFNAPMDFGKSLGGIRVFGTNKTIRGLIVGTVIGLIVTLVQSQLHMDNPELQRLLPINYNEFDVVVFGVLTGFGSMMGDAIKSFFKRRVGIKPGGQWVPFDQIDYTLGATFFTFLVAPLPLVSYITTIIIGAILTPDHECNRIYTQDQG